MRHFKIFPNSYYHFFSKGVDTRKTAKEKALPKIVQLYHNHNGVDGYRSMKVFLEREGILLSNTTVHQYMNRELGLYSVVRRKKPNRKQGRSHKVFKNLVQQNFTVDTRNTLWCTDFTYLYLANGSKRYNCTILDLHDRSVIASTTGREIGSALAVRTLRKTLRTQNIRIALETI